MEQVLLTNAKNEQKSRMRTLILGTKHFLRKMADAPAAYLAFSFALPALIMFLVYAVRGTYPFGDGSVLVLDLNAQYVYFFEYLRKVLQEGGSLIYSWERAMGGEFIGIYAYYLASPFSFLVGLFPDGYITEALLLIFLLKVGSCGAAFGFYVHKTHPTKDKLSVILFSTLYALCSYAIVYQSNTMWIDEMIYLPLLVYAVDQLIARRRVILYTFILALSMLSNFYIGYMMCIFTLFYFFYRYLTCPDGSARNFYGETYHFPRTLVRIGVATVIALAMSMIIILPTYYSLQFGKNEFQQLTYTWYQKFDWLNFSSTFFLGSFDTMRPEGLPLMYCGILTLILFPLYFICKRIPTRERVGGGVLIGFFLISFSVSNLDIFWHGMAIPNWLNHRYAFMLIFFLVLFAYRAYTHLSEFRFSQIAAIVAMLAFVIVCVEKLALEHLGNFDFVTLNLAVLALYLPLLGGVMKRAIPKYGPSLLLAIATFGIEAFVVYYFIGISDLKTALICAMFMLLCGGILSCLVCKLPIYLAAGGVILQLILTLLIYHFELLSRGGVFAMIGVILLYLFVYLVRVPLARLRTATLMLLTLISLELVGGTAITMNDMHEDVWFSSRSSYTNFMKRVTPIIEQVQAYDTSFYRMEKTLHRCVNDNMTLGLRGLSNSTSTLNASVIQLLNRLGYASISHWSKYAGGTPVSDALMGIKYVISDVEIHSPYYELVFSDEANKLYAYEARYYMSVAAAVSPNLKDLELTDPDGTRTKEVHLSPFEVMNAMVSSMVGSDLVKMWLPCGGAPNYPTTKNNTKEGRSYSDYYEFVPVDSNKNASITYSFTVRESEADIYMFFPTEYLRQAKWTLNGKDKGFIHTSDTDHIFSLGRYKAGDEIEVTLTLQQSNMFLSKDVNIFYYLNEGVFERRMAQLASQSMEITNFTDTLLEGTLNVPEHATMLYTSIPYDAGWNLYVDGERVETYKTADCLLAADLTPGDHTIKLEYMSKEFVFGVIGSVLGVIGFVGLIVFDIYMRSRRAAKFAARVSVYKPTCSASSADNACNTTDASPLLRDPFEDDIPAVTPFTTGEVVNDSGSPVASEPVAEPQIEVHEAPISVQIEVPVVEPETPQKKSPTATKRTASTKKSTTAKKSAAPKKNTAVKKSSTAKKTTTNSTRGKKQ